MGVIGSLLYPGNEERARELNDKEDTIRRINNLHNDLVNDYRSIAEQVKTFDSYLMSLTAMHYHIAYNKEDLANLPDDDLPEISKHVADTISTAIFDGFTVYMGIVGFKAIKSGVTNLIKSTGRFSRTASSGGDAVAAGLGAEAEMTSIQAPAMSAANVEIMTSTGSGADMAAMSAEAGAQAAAVNSAVDAASASGDVAASADTVELAANSANTAELGATVGGSGWAAASTMSKAFYILAFAAAVVLVVTEIIGAIQRADDRDDLIEAAEKMDKAIADLNTSVVELKKSFKALLNAGKTDIEMYNKLLKELAALEHAHALAKRNFSTAGFTDYIDAIDAIDIDHTTSIAHNSHGVKANLDDAINFIRDHAVHDAPMAAVISEIKTHMRREGLTTLADDHPFLKEVADVNSLTLETVQKYNQFRIYVASLSSMIKKYHVETQELNQGNTGLPKTPKTFEAGDPDPEFDPTPGDFTIPVVRGQKHHA